MEDATKSGTTNEVEEDQEDQVKKYFKNVLDDIVSLNSLFTIGVFVGLSLATPGQVQSLEDRSECNSNTQLRKRLVMLEIASFSCFVFSGFLAKTAKIFLYIYQSKEKNPHKKKLTLISFYLSIYGTFTGCCCLLFAMVDVVQIKIGRLSCGSVYAIHTVIVLLGLISPALCIYFLAVSYGLFTAASGAMRGIHKRSSQK